MILFLELTFLHKLIGYKEVSEDKFDEWYRLDGAKVARSFQPQIEQDALWQQFYAQ